MQGQRLDAVFVERGVSGSVPLVQRPEGARLWAGLRRGDTVVAAKLDRLFRSALDALQAVEDLKTRGVSLVLLDLGGDISVAFHPDKPVTVDGRQERQNRISVHYRKRPSLAP